MKRKSFLIFFSIFALMLSLSFCFVGDIPIISYITIGEKEYVKQKILKCKDVESVEFERRSDYQEDDAYSIYVYLTNNRFISFADIELYHFKTDTGRGWPKTLLQINDLVPIVQYFEPLILQPQESTIKYVGSFKGWVPINLLSKLMQKKINNITNIINSIDYVYDYIDSLPELPDNTPEHIYFDGSYDQDLQIPKELENDVPFSIIEQKKYYNSCLKISRTYEKRFKFYKLTVEDAQKRYPYAKLKTDF